MAHITCLYFYDMAISPVEHHTNITALAVTQKTAEVTINAQKTHKQKHSHLNTTNTDARPTQGINMCLHFSVYYARTESPLDWSPNQAVLPFIWIKNWQESLPWG
jgi:hypothetical protein